MLVDFRGMSGGLMSLQELVQFTRQKHIFVPPAIILLQ